MTAEITILAYAGILQVIQMVLFIIAGDRQIGMKAAMGPRDTPPDLTGTAGRIQRAMNNHFEGLILFTLAVVVVTLSNSANAFTEICAWVYLASRILYIPAYIFGWVPWRSFIWITSFAASAVMIISAVI